MGVDGHLGLGLDAKGSPEIILARDGEFARTPEAETAFGGSRQTRFIVNVLAVASTAELLDADRAWARATWTALVPYAEGASYVNFMAEYEGDRVKASYGSKYERLAKIKAAYDPDNVFHLNANVQPGNG
jgi:Berberine and berberine like